MGSVVKRMIIALVALFIVLGIASFAVDRMALNNLFNRTERENYGLMPTFDDYASNHTRTPVEFQMNGMTLRGYVYETANPKGFIVFRHGISSSHVDYLPLIMAMVDRGWTVFAYDALGCGESDGYSQLGMPQSALDVAAAVDYVRTSGIAGDLPLVLWGHSWGGYGVAAALDLIPDVAACITMSGYNAPVDVLYEGTRQIVGPLAITQYPVLWLCNFLDFRDNANRTALDGINKADVPVLVVHGVSDETVSYTGASIIAQRDRITNPNVEYLVLDEPGRDTHYGYFYSAESNEYLTAKRTEYLELRKQYKNDIPEDVNAAFFADYDMLRANTADPVLIDAFDIFLTNAIGGAMPQQADATEVLTSVQFTDSGNSLGNLYSLETVRTNDGELLLVERTADMWSDPITVREYRLPDDFIEQAGTLIDKYGMKDWGDLPPSELFPLDASTPTLHFTYTKTNPAPDELPVTWISFTVWTEFPEGGTQQFWEVAHLLSSQAVPENLVREYVEEKR